MSYIERVVFLVSLTILFNLKLNAQTSFQNFGNIQIHNGGEIGFHTNLINDGVFNQNKGLAGFYNSTNALNVSGANKTVFHDVEVDVLDDLYLETSLGIGNNLSFISGKIITLRDEPNVSLDFLNYNVYSGEGDSEHVDGFVSTNNSGEFIFPIGNNDVFRPMIIPNQLPNSYYKGAYFNENPNNPSLFIDDFDTSKKQLVIDKVSEVEFWNLKGSVETAIILTWDTNSEIGLLTPDIQKLLVVGWDINLKIWVDIGHELVEGDMENGYIKSKAFIPDNYEVITIGTDIRTVLGIVRNGENFTVTPNGDGINDFFNIESIGLRPNNNLKIVNRWGALVYDKNNYDNTWNGISNHKSIINKNEGLPAGTYYYFLKFMDSNVTWHGYIFLGR